MKKRSAIIKFVVVGVITLIGLLATFLTFPAGNYDYNGFIYSINLGLDLQGGVYAVYEASGSDANPSDTRMNGTVKQLTQLLSAKGYTEATVVREGSKRIRVEVPDVDDPEEIFSIIGEPAEIAFLLESGENNYETVLTGDHVENAVAQYQSSDGKYVVLLSLNSAGATKFAQVTSENKGKNIRIDVTRGGETQTISNATINDAITGGNAVISGDFDYDSANELADQIMSGTFSVTLELKECSVVSPTLGENALLSGLIGGAVAFILIIAFMCIFYRMFGVVAAASMIIYMVLMFMLLGLLPWVQLTLPGIAGIILSLGMMIDGNIIIYERIKDEFREGKSILAAYYAGFKKATSAIVDGNITTIIAAVMLLIFGTGSIQGFGITLLVGLILSIFSSLVVTRFLLKWTLAINNTNRNLYNLKRKEGFDESKEEQYFSKEKEKHEQPDGIRLVDGAMPEGVMNE